MELRVVFEVPGRPVIADQKQGAHRGQKDEEDSHDLAALEFAGDDLLHRDLEFLQVLLGDEPGHEQSNEEKGQHAPDSYLTEERPRTLSVQLAVTSNPQGAPDPVKKQECSLNDPCNEGLSEDSGDHEGGQHVVWQFVHSEGLGGCGGRGGGGVRILRRQRGASE